MVVTEYKPDGTKVRRPIGYKGGQCSKATEPYEAREIQGQTQKAPTPDAYECEPVQEKLTIGE